MKPHYRLLIVEDSAEDVELLLHHLRDARFTFSSSCVETEADYRAALLAELPQLVLCDYHLPRFSAARALEILQERALEIPFIVVSHHIGEDAAVDAMRNGASDYLLKNRLARLAKAIEVAVERRESAEQKALADAALRDSEAMKRGILNSLNTRIAVLNGSGRILAANKSWEDFSDSRGRVQAGHAAVGVNYLDLLRDAANRGDELAARHLKAIQSIINRETSFASVEYQRTGTGGARWFMARAMPLEGSNDGAVISHEDVTDRMLAHRALGDANKRLQVMSKRILGIQEEERRRISRELHDDIGQSLTALKIGLHRMAQRVNEEHKGLLTECLGVADSTLDKLRQLSFELRPPQLDQLGLEGALEWLVDQQRGATGLDVRCQFAGISQRLPVELEGACYRITQEALNNATRHANAKQIQIRVELNDRLLMLVIRDDGIGFDIARARIKAIKTGSLGLVSMEERAQLAGGRLSIRSIPGTGTTIQVTFALDAQRSSNNDMRVDQHLSGVLWD
jgi:two-component system, NarL family, sensor histidine kinase UhpB